MHFLTPAPFQHYYLLLEEEFEKWARCAETNVTLTLFTFCNGFFLLIDNFMAECIVQNGNCKHFMYQFTIDWKTIEPQVCDLSNYIKPEVTVVLINSSNPREQRQESPTQATVAKLLHCTKQSTIGATSPSLSGHLDKLNKIPIFDHTGNILTFTKVTCYDSSKLTLAVSFQQKG